MELQLTLKGPERLLGGRTDARLRDGALVIGRSPEADWAIADPERIISKVHCRIEKDFDSFQLTDLSTNGVRVNETPVGYGLACRIENGDVVKLGDAVLTVRIVAPQPVEKAAPAVSAELPPDGPFGEPGVESQVAATDAPLQRPVEAPAAGVVLDDWWGPVAETAVPAAQESPANPVDISANPISDTIDDVHAGEDALLSGDTGVASLLRVAVGLDVEKLAQAVGEAVAVLPAGERDKFRERLSEILRDASRR